MMCTLCVVAGRLEQKKFKRKYCFFVCVSYSNISTKIIKQNGKKENRTKRKQQKKYHFKQEIVEH